MNGSSVARYWWLDQRVRTGSVKLLLNAGGRLLEPHRFADGGGTKTGKVCSDSTEAKGQYVLIYKPNAFESDRGIWLSRCRGGRPRWLTRGQRIPAATYRRGYGHGQSREPP
jgi:hypothetical protein